MCSLDLEGFVLCQMQDVSLNTRCGLNLQKNCHRDDGENQLKICWYTCLAYQRDSPFCGFARRKQLLVFSGGMDDAFSLSVVVVIGLFEVRATEMAKHCCGGRKTEDHG